MTKTNDEADVTRNHALHRAVTRNHVAKVARILRRGGDANAPNEAGYTPLHLAVRVYDPVAVVRLLLDHGASVDGVDKVGCTPLHLAARTHNAALVRLLLDRGASVDGVDRVGYTPLHVAVVHRPYAFRRASGRRPPYPQVVPTQDMIALLLHHGARLDRQDRAGWTPLARAVKAEHYEAVAALLQHGATVELRTSLGETPLHAALRHHLKEYTHWIEYEMTIPP